MAADPVIIAKLVKPGPVTKILLEDWQRCFKDSKYVGHSATKTGGTAYAKFTVPSVHPTKLVRIPIRMNGYYKRTVANTFNDMWIAWAKLTAETKYKDPLKINGHISSMTNSWSEPSLIKSFLEEIGLTNANPAVTYESFFTFVGFVPELTRAFNDVSSSSVVYDKKKNHEIETAMYDIRAPLRTLLRHGIEREQIRDMIDEEIVKLITEG